MSPRHCKMPIVMLTAIILFVWFFKVLKGFNPLNNLLTQPWNTHSNMTLKMYSGRQFSSVRMWHGVNGRAVPTQTQTQSQPPQHLRQNLRPHAVFWFPVFSDMTLFQWTNSYVGSLDHQDEGTMILWTVWNRSPNNMSHPRDEGTMILWTVWNRSRNNVSHPSRTEHTTLQLWHITLYCSLTAHTVTHLTRYWEYNVCSLFLQHFIYPHYIRDGGRKIRDISWEVSSYCCISKLFVCLSVCYTFNQSTHGRNHRI
jgi:hypothetical protein